MNKAEEYQKEYEEIESEIKDISDTVSSLRLLVEDMIEVIRELEETASQEYQTKKLKLEASIRTGIKTND